MSAILHETYNLTCLGEHGLLVGRNGSSLRINQLEEDAEDAAVPPGGHQVRNRTLRVVLVYLCSNSNIPMGILKHFRLARFTLCYNVTNTTSASSNLFNYYFTLAWNVKKITKHHAYGL